jgi:hypothetical protein
MCLIRIAAETPITLIEVLSWFSSEPTGKRRKRSSSGLLSLLFKSSPLSHPANQCRVGWIVTNHKTYNKNNRRKKKLHCFQMSYSNVIIKLLPRTVCDTCPSSVLPTFCHSVRLLVRKFVRERRDISFSYPRYRVLWTSSMKPLLHKSLNGCSPYRTRVA